MARNKIQVPGAEADLTNFNRATDRLAKLSGKPVEEVIKHRVGVILNAAVKKSKVDSVKRLKSRSSAKHSTKLVTGSSVKAALYRTMSKVNKERTNYVKINGRWINAKEHTRMDDSVGVRLAAKRHRAGGWTVGKRFAAKLKATAAAQQKVYAEKLKIDSAARGLGPRAFVEMGRKLGLNISAPGYVMKANYEGKTLHQLSKGKSDHNEKGDSFVEVKTTVGKADKTAIYTAAKGQNAAMFRAVKKSRDDQLSKTVAGLAGVDVK